MERNKLVEDHYRKNYSRNVGWVAWRLGNDYILAEEIVQEAYTRSLYYFSGFDSRKGEFGHWFSFILNNVMRRVQSVERSRGVNQDTVILPEYENDYFHNGLVNKINEDKNKYILLMFFVDGFKTKDISSILNINHNNVRQIISRFRDKLTDDPSGLV